MNLKAIALLFLFNCIVAVLGQSGLTRDGFPYLIRQRQNENGTTELYSPYFLWNPLLRNTFTVLAEPLKVYSNKGKLDIKMTVEVATISTGLFSYRTRVYCYESICSTPGPTLIVKPGDVVRIELINCLENSSSTSTLSQFSTEEFFPNRTNLFFQSLPIDPTINSPFRFTQGNGDSIFYTFRIRSNMPRGIHWYHSHVHGVSSLHVMGGLFGAVIIEEMDTASFPAYFASVPRKTVVLSHLFIEPNASMYLPNIPNTHRFSLQDDDFETSSLSLKYLSRAFGSRIDLNVSYSNTSNFRTTDVWLVNNLFQPTYVTTPGAWVIFDIVVASGDRIVELEMRSALPGTVGSHRSCSMRLLGRNGYYFDQARKGEAVDHLILLQGDRASLAIMCPTNGTFFLTTLADTRESEAYYHVGDWTTKSTQMIAQIQTYGVFNDNSSAIDATFQDLSFLRVDTPITNLLAKYNVQNAQTLPLFSLSTAQSSAPVRSRIPRDPCALVTPQAVNTSAYPYNHGPTAALSRYTIGAGVNCRNPCYDDVLCTALFGNDSYSVDDFTVAMNRECGFVATQLFNVGQNPLHCASTINVTQLVVDVWTNKTQFDTSSQQQGPQNVSQLLPGTISLTTSQRLYRMQLYGHASFPYPIYLQNHDVQVLSFDNVGVQTSNIFQRDEYAPRYNYDMGTYGYQVNDRRDSLLPLQGRMTFLVELAGADVSATTQGTALYPVLSTYLKFSDRGFLRFVHLNLQNDTSTDTNTTVPSPTPNPSPTPVPPTTLPTDKTITVNYTQGVEVDSNGQPFVCDIAGRSSLYEERIDLTTMTRVIRMNSCPNHYSVCQSAQCGGEQKTRALKWYREVRVPLYPVLAAAPQDMTCAVDMVGIAANGVGIFSPAQGGVQSCVFFQNDTRSRFGRTSCVAGFRGEGLLTCGDSMHWNRRQLDKCGGYADEFYHNQNFSGLYRYTSLPTCLFHQLTVNATSSTSSSASSASSLAVSSTANAPRKGHSVQLGWAMDGFPIYGPVGIRGILMRRCGVAGAHPQICLDNCNGYYGRLPGVDEYLYRYYMTGNHTTTTSDVTAGEVAPKCSRFVRNSNGEQIERCDRLSSSCCRDTVPDGSFFPYTIGCFRGCVLSTDIAKETGVYTKNDCLLTAKKATTTSFIPHVLPSASSFYSDPESQALYSGPVATNAGRTISSSTDTAAATDATGTGTSSSDNSSASSATDATASLLRTTRRVLYRDPYDLSLDVFTTRRVTRDESTGSIVSVDIDGQVLGGIRNREALAPEVASITYDETDGTVNTIVPEANADHFFSGMVVDHRCHMMYFTDQQRIYKQLLHPETAQPLTTSPPALVVAGIIKVDLFGYNLGRIYEDIVQIRVKDSDFCTSIVHVSSTHVSCLLISAIAAANDSVGSQLNAQDVMVRTVSGVAYGISLDALSQVEAGMTRPVLTRVHFSRLPLVPYGLSMVIDPMGDRASIPTTLMSETAGRTTAVSTQEAITRCQSGDDVTLYWTNTAATPLGHNIQRVRGSGTHLETIARGVRQGRGLFAMAALVDTRNTSLAFYDRSLWQIANLSASVDDNTRTVYNTYVVPRYDTTCLGTGYEYNRLIQRRGPSAVYPSDNRSELIYDVIMEYIESTGVDPRIYTSPCRYRLGHVLFVAEAGDTGRLVRLQVLPIQPNGLVFQPYLAYDASGLFRPDFDDVELAKDMSRASWTTYSANDTSSYSMVFYEQTQPQPVVVAWTTTLLHRVWSIQSVEADFVANRLYATTRDHGLVLSMDLSVLLNAQTTATATATATVVSTTSTEPQPLMTMWPMSFDIRSWQLACASPQLQANPLQWPVSWLRLVHCGNLVTRAHGLLVFPLALDALVPATAALMSNDSATTIDVPKPWSLKQRLVLVDTNQQQLVAIREENMFTTRSTDLGRSFQLYFPHQLRWFSSQTMTSAQGEAMIRHRLLVSEYLGRFWTVDVWSSLNNDTLWLDDVTLKPALVLDWSAFTASIKVREVLANNRLEGAASYDTIFFEASP